MLLDLYNTRGIFSYLVIDIQALHISSIALNDIYQVIYTTVLFEQYLQQHKQDAHVCQPKGPLQ